MRKALEAWPRGRPRGAKQSSIRASKMDDTIGDSPRGPASRPAWRCQAGLEGLDPPKKRKQRAPRIEKSPGVPASRPGTQYVSACPWCPVSVRRIASRSDQTGKEFLLTGLSTISARFPRWSEREDVRSAPTRARAPGAPRPTRGAPCEPCPVAMRSRHALSEAASTPPSARAPLAGGCWDNAWTTMLAARGPGRRGLWALRLLEAARGVVI